MTGVVHNRTGGRVPGRRRAGHDAPMDQTWRKIAVLAVGGLTEVGFAPGSDHLLVVSHQGRGLLDCRTGERVARDDDEGFGWFDSARRVARAIGPLAGLEIEVAGLSGGVLPTATPDGWRAEAVAGGVVLTGPGGDRLEVDDPEDLRAFGFSPDGRFLVVASSPTLHLYGRAGLTPGR